MPTTVPRRTKSRRVIFPATYWSMMWFSSSLRSLADLVDAALRLVHMCPLLPFSRSARSPGPLAYSSSQGDRVNDGGRRRSSQRLRRGEPQEVGRSRVPRRSSRSSRKAVDVDIDRDRARSARATSSGAACRRPCGRGRARPSSTSTRRATRAEELRSSDVGNGERVVDGRASVLVGLRVEAEVEVEHRRRPRLPTAPWRRRLVGVLGV